jgi:hypothetical protein
MGLPETSLKILYWTLSLTSAGYVSVITTTSQMMKRRLGVLLAASRSLPMSWTSPDSGPQPVIEADSNNTDGNLAKLCTMLRRHEPVFLKFSQESPQILANSVSAAKDLMQLTILVNKTNEDRAAEAKRQAEHDKDVMLILKKADRACTYQEILACMRTM